MESHHGVELGGLPCNNRRGTDISDKLQFAIPLWYIGSVS